MINKAPKISVIGDGRVGSVVAYSLLLKELAGEIMLVDYNKNFAEGDALDMLHASAFTRQTDIVAGDYEDTKGSDIVIITASIPMKDIKSRLDLCQGNTELFKDIIPRLVKASPEAVLILISNPLDIMTYIALKISKLAAGKVIGTGTMIDSGRFRALVASEARICPDEIHAFILGEHGDSQFPAFSSAEVGGRRFRDRSKDKLKELFDQTVKGGYAVMQKKGFTNYAIAMATATLVDSIVNDRKKIYPVSTLINDYHGFSDLCISVPAVIGRNGVERVVDMEFTPEEEAAFKKSARMLQDINGSIKF
ncbi:MAG: L-lactate dehydrogenase [Candidatus Margulisiibacteriota bacterium]|nr:L-lactate dehydrogenase [Candidatus Margulisiibacteriota bacterium]